jgi:carbon-monoxide dehydrogenase large subunit
VRHLGVREIEMPLSPQRVWRALRDGEAGAAGEQAAAGPHWDEPAQTAGVEPSAERSETGTTDEGSPA